MAAAGVISMDPVAGVAAMQPFSWILVVGIVGAFSLGFAMGANDIANAFGTSVGAGILTITQACAVAAVFDVMGSLTLGVRVSSTIAGKIIDVSIYDEEPGLFMLGMLSANLASTLMVGGATKFGLPVSTTHAVVGAVMGFSFVQTTDGLVWWKGHNGLGAIMVSWVLSPIFAGAVAAAVYKLARWYCFQYAEVGPEGQLKYANSDTTEAGASHEKVMTTLALVKHRRMSAVVMGWVGFLVALLLAYEFTQPGTIYDYVNVFIAFGVWLLLALFGYYVVVPRVIKRQDINRLLLPADQPSYSSTDSGTAEGYTRNEHTYLPELENRCHVLSVITASFMAFTHGANDISNAAGPLVAIWNIYTSGSVGKSVNVAYWVIVLCCFGVITGLFLWGAYVIRTVGFKITKITPSRAFTIELGTATSVLIASFLAMPVSSTHCFIGAVVAVGMVSGEGKKAIKWDLIKKIFASWVLTVPIAAGFSAVIFASLKVCVRGVQPPTGYTLAFVNASEIANAEDL